MTDKPVRDYDKFMLRFPDGMRDAVAERAKANGRSMNSEIIQILEDALSGKARSIRFDMAKGEPIEIEDVDNPEKIIKALTELAVALTDMKKKNADIDTEDLLEDNKKPT